MVEGVAQFLRVIAHVDHAAAGLFRQLAHIAVTVISPAVEATVRDQNHIDDSVCLLRDLDRFGQSRVAALVLSVGEQDHGFASDLVRKHLARSQVDSVEQQSPLGITKTRYRSLPDARDRTDLIAYLQATMK